MGEIAEAMIDGCDCSWCGVFLEPNETIYTINLKRNSHPKDKMPSNGEGYGCPVICEDCYNHRD